MTHYINKSKRSNPFLYKLLRRSPLLLLFLFFSFLSSCKNELIEIYELDESNKPDIVIKDPVILRSTSGKVGVKLEAKTAERFLGEKGVTKFPEGIFVTFYDEDNSIKKTLSAKEAKSEDNDNIVMAEKDVVIIDYVKGDTVYTEQIIWDQYIQKIYSEKPVKQVNGANVTYGGRFVMDEQTGSLIIYNQGGAHELDEE